ESLLTLLEEVRSDVTAGAELVKALSHQIEIWFDHSMDRLSGWYKRRTQSVLFCVAVLFVAVLNMDTVAICKSLTNDPVLRQSLVARAQAAATQPATVTLEPNQDLQQQLSKVAAAVNSIQGQLPMGWTKDEITALHKPDRIEWWACITKLFGLLMTA